MTASNSNTSQCMQHSPFSYRNDRLRQLQRKPSTSSNPFIAGVDASDLWLSPPQGSLDDDDDEQQRQHNRASSLPTARNNQQHRDFTLLGGDASLLPSFAASYSSPPSPGTAAVASSSSSSALFPSIDSWIHQNSSVGIDKQEDDYSAYYPQASTSYSPPPSSAGALSSPSSSSASSSSPRLFAEQQRPLPPEPARRRSTRRKSSLNMASSNVNSNPAVISTDSGTFNVNSKSGMKDACSYDLRDHQEPPTVQKEYAGNNTSENKDLQGLQSKVESTPGPVCFPRTADTPAPSSPSRFANPQDVKPHVGAEPAGATDLASGKPLSSSSAKSNGNSTNNNNIALDPSLGQDASAQQLRPGQRAGQPSFLKNTGDGVIRTPGPGQMVSPKEAFRDFEDVLKTRPQTQLQTSPRLQHQQQQQGSPMQQSVQYKQPQSQQQQQQRDIQVPQMTLPQMPAPQQPQQNSFQAQLQQPPPPGQAFDGADAQLLAALGASHSLSHQGSPPNRGQQLPGVNNQQQQQQQQRGMQHQMGNQGSPQQQRQLQTQPAPAPMTVQQQNAARQAAYQGFMAHPPPTGPNSSTDIQVPQSNAPTNVGTPSAGQSSLPPLPNYQSAPAPLAFNDGSFFSHQAILASLAAEEQAKAAAAAAAVMGFQNGTWSGGNGQQQQNGGNNSNNQGQFNFAQPGQQQGQQQGGQQGQLPNFAGGPGTSSVLGDFSFEQHFGAPTPAGQSPDASTSSRKRIKGKSGSRGTLSRSNSTTSNNGSGRSNNSIQALTTAEARALLSSHQGSATQPPQYNGAFNFGTYAANSSAHDLSGDGGNDEDESKPQFNSRGIQKRKSASTARELAQAQQKDHGEEYEYQGYIPKGSGSAGGVGLPPSAGLASAGGGGGGGGDDSDDSDDDDDGDEWVAEESDDSYGKKRRGGNNKRGRKSTGASKYASLTPAEAEALRAASPTTAAAALASVNANGQFDFSQLMGDYSGIGSPDGSASGSTPGASSSKKRKSNAAAPGSGNISCDYVDPKTGERCPVKFRRPYDQARHMETVHSGTAEKSKWACITCKKSFSRKDALIRHGRISNHATM